MLSRRGKKGPECSQEIVELRQQLGKNRKSHEHTWDLRSLSTYVQKCGVSYASYKCVPR